jgi:hypothetical protein
LVEEEAGVVAGLLAEKKKEATGMVGKKTLMGLGGLASLSIFRKEDRIPRHSDERVKCLHW